MSSLRAKARKVAFGDFTESFSSRNSSSSSFCQNSARSRSSFEPVPGIVRHSSSISESSCTCHSTPEKAVNIMPRRTNHVQRIKKEHSVDEFIDALEADGCVLVEDFVSPEISRRVHTAEDQQPQEEFNETTVDVNALVRESFVSDRLFESISSHFLTLETLSWQDKQIQMDVSQPSVYSSITKSANQHSKPQCFHRADSRFHVRHIAAARYEYQPRRDASIGLFVPDFDDAQSSATIKVVPGSQLWNDQKPDFSKGVVEVELREGDALILLGSLYHSVSSSKLMMDVSNTASKRDTGFLHEVWMCSGIYRSA